jgi:hypothetical protein
MNVWECVEYEGGAAKVTYETACIFGA